MIFCFPLNKPIRVYLENHKEWLVEYKQVICCSDIIESSFGKFKNEQDRNLCKVVTIGCLKIANYQGKGDKKILKEARENTKIIDLNKWKEENELMTLNKKWQKMEQKVR